MTNGLASGQESSRNGAHSAGVSRGELQQYLDALLECARFKDYCPNGLQVEGRAQIRRVVCGVTASLELIEAAIAREADAIVVHHGWFWRGEDGRVTGTRKRRMARLLEHDLNLFAFHLPLDAHSELGNNAQLARVMGWRIDGRFAEQDIGFLGVREAGADTAGELARELSSRLGREALLVGEAATPVGRIAWCSGGAQGYFEQAILAGASLYVSGEISEPTAHLARESGVPYIAAGHHATERFGARALGEHLASRFGLVSEFVDIDNPA